MCTNCDGVRISQLNSELTTLANQIADVEGRITNCDDLIGEAEAAIDKLDSCVINNYRNVQINDSYAASDVCAGLHNNLVKLYEGLEQKKVELNTEKNTYKSLQAAKQAELSSLTAASSCARCAPKMIDGWVGSMRWY